MKTARKTEYKTLSEIFVDGKRMTQEAFDILCAQAEFMRKKIKAFNYTRINGVAKLQIVTA